MRYEGAGGLGVFVVGGCGEGYETWEEIAGYAGVGGGFGGLEEERADAACCYFGRLFSSVRLGYMGKGEEEVPCDHLDSR